MYFMFLVEMLHQINNTTFSVKYEQSKGSSEGEYFNKEKNR